MQIQTSLVVFCSFLVVKMSWAASTDIDFQMDLDVGYRIDELNWTNAGTSTGTNPNILSELTWQDLRIAEVRLKGQMAFPLGLQVRSDFGFGEIISGDNQDSDFSTDNRGDEFSRSNNSTDGDDVWGGQVALGWRLDFIDPSVHRPFWLLPWLGYSYREQHLRLTDGVQTIPATGAFSGLNSTYQAEWDGYWAGLEIWMQATQRARIFFDLQYHWSDFYAQGQWNLRASGADALAQPKSYEHSADATGFVGTFGWVYQHSLQSPWQIKLQGHYENWSTDAGIHRIFPATGGSAETRLNEVDWRSATWSVGLLVAF